MNKPSPGKLGSKQSPLPKRVEILFNHYYRKLDRMELKRTF